MSASVDTQEKVIKRFLLGLLINSEQDIVQRAVCDFFRCVSTHSLQVCAHTVSPAISKMFRKHWMASALFAAAVRLTGLI